MRSERKPIDEGAPLRLRIVALLGALLLSGAAAGCVPEGEEPPIEAPAEQEAEEDAGNRPDPESEDQSDLEDAGDVESSEEESTVEEDDIQPDEGQDDY